MNKKWMLLSCSILLAGIAVFNIVSANKVIGCYYGSEYEYIKVDDVVYKADYANSYSSSDRRRRLGNVLSQSGEGDPMYIWSVNGTDDYLYALSVYDGTFYKKIEQ